MPDVETILSKPQTKIDWKLNELLAADRRAREYARQSGQPGLTAADSFAPWSPLQLDIEQPGPVTRDIDASQEEPEAHSGIEEASSTDRVDTEQEPVAADPDIETLVANARAAGESSGYARAMAELEQGYAQQRQELQSVLEAISSARVDLGTYVDFTRELAVLLAEQVVRAELVHSADKIRKLVEDAIARLGPDTESEIEIRANARTLEVLRQAVMDEEAMPTLLEDRHLGDGDFVFRMGDTEGVESVSEKIRKLASALFDHPAAQADMTDTDTETETETDANRDAASSPDALSVPLSATTDNLHAEDQMEPAVSTAPEGDPMPLPVADTDDMSSSAQDTQGPGESEPELDEDLT